MSPSAASPTPWRALRSQLGRVAEAASSPLLPADFLDLFAPLRRGAELRGRVVSVHAETKDAATLLIKPGADWAGHVPGQYLRIGIDVDGVRQWRAYSLTHGPRADGRISITVKAVPDGLVSNHLVHEARPGTIVADIVYVPLRTALLAEAEARGLRVVDGLGMLLHQAVPGFHRWFGVMPEVTPDLRARIVADLGGGR